MKLRYLNVLEFALIRKSGEKSLVKSSKDEGTFLIPFKSKTASRSKTALILVRTTTFHYNYADKCSGVNTLKPKVSSIVSRKKLEAEKNCKRGRKRENRRRSYKDTTVVVDTG